MTRLSPEEQERLMTTIERWLRKHFRQRIDLRALEREFGINRFLLCRLYHERSGKTLRLKQREIRIDRAARLLAEGGHKVAEVAHAVGYGSSSHFTKAFLAEKGMLPSEWKSRPRVLALPRSAGALPAPGLKFLRLVGEVPPELALTSGHWNPAQQQATVRPLRRPRLRVAGSLPQANAFLD
jgi:AraC-like DNA-binding protein